MGTTKLAAGEAWKKLQTGRLQRAPQLHGTTREFLWGRREQGLGVGVIAIWMGEERRGAGAAAGGGGSCAGGSDAALLQKTSAAAALLIVLLTSFLLPWGLPPQPPRSSERPLKTSLKASNSV